ncbi:double-strand break repair protein AddB [Ciceribacter sp. L1K23]|uniref:double-strand break repair protein AddB n=1 Tax=Ciceribacter sp. L1K23 TaxID=2820276 RepID=UPI001B8118C2|nr:double-strand break repair protein AddB [Ciceribacter sp. L1K23]MBR0557629.1 double-strand break repair protein AddB [Ciceribacter sp. L1K23]
MTRGREGQIMTIAPGVPFLRELASGLLNGRLIRGFRHDPTDPLALAKITIYLPTRRAARELRSEFVDLMGGRTAILPIIKPLGETEEDLGYFDVDAPDILDLYPPISNTARLIELGRLILAWRNQLPEIVRSLHSDTPLVAPASPADAVWLARALAELIDAIETEETDWNLLETIEAGNFAGWWQLTLEFLKIARTFWPDRLNELNRSSPVRHRNAQLRGEAARLLALDSRDPVIIAGSTGSIPAAAELIAAAASIPEGIVVLPGLDQTMPDAHWSLVGAELGDKSIPDPASRSHPQYGLSQLLKQLGVHRNDVTALGRPDDDLADRAQIISRALTPAGATDSWMEWRSSFDPGRISNAFKDVSLIEAANEREEAAAIATALRLALEDVGAAGESRVALVTPDRNLAKRVVAELARYHIAADDTAGTPLTGSRQGTILGLLLEACLQPGNPTTLAGLLKHPLARFGCNEHDIVTSAEMLELLALRGGTKNANIKDVRSLLEDQLKAQSQERHPPLWRKNLGEEAVAAAATLATLMDHALAYLKNAADRRLPLSEWAVLTGQALEAVCIDDRGDLSSLWGDEAGEKLANLLEQIIETDGQLEATGLEWIDLVEAFSAGEAVKPRAMRHPRVFIFGTLEARLQNVDTMVLGGLNEGSWPTQTTNNPFLSRTMKTDIGLQPPERRTGQLAHDFEMACGTRKLIFSRSLRQGNTPTVASRWLQRLLALAGDGLAEELRLRGDRYRQFVAMLDEGEAQPAARRPEPRPDAALQPRQYSFSEVARLRRDPYSVYARRILRLEPIAPFSGEPGPAERGTLYHKIVERLVREAMVSRHEVERSDVERIINECFAAAKLPPHIDVVWRHRFWGIADPFLQWEQNRQGSYSQSFTEVPAGFELEGAGIRLTGVADRIDIRIDGLADIIDYKTGSSPSVAQARSLLDPQLPLEAAALQAGAFKNVGIRNANDLLYVRLRPGARFGAEAVNNEQSGKGDKVKSASDLGSDAASQLNRFVALLFSGERGFVSRLIPFQQGDLGGDYDHLARVAEWSTAEADEVGDE